VEFPKVVIAKWKLLRRAFERFRIKADAGEKEAFRRFCDSKEWLPGYATYVTRGGSTELAEVPLNGNACWDEWQSGKDVTRPDASVELHKQFISFVQFVFFEQWKRLKNYANNKGIYIAGDISYGVALESCDLWESPRLFEVDPVTGKMKLESGAPPDEFAPQGQCWGMPTYAWSVHKQDGFKWWRMRIAESAALYDVIRLDHFRGFESSWSIPAGSKGATDGYFVRGPGKAFLEAISEAASSAQVFVEDLGFITDEVHALRESLGLPGISVLQFAFEGQKGHPHLPYNWEFIRLALSSVAKWAVIPVQDLLGLGNEARMNISGVLSKDNWRWRLGQHEVVTLNKRTIVQPDSCLRKATGSFEPRRKVSESLARLPTIWTGPLSPWLLMDSSVTRIGNEAYSIALSPARWQICPG
jgi:4-alpha-glucanotransferase